MKSREIHDRFMEVVGEIPALAKEILADKSAGARTRWDVSKDLMDRFGFPAVKATLNQNLTGGTADIERLLKARNELAEEQQRLMGDLREIQRQIAPPVKGATDAGSIGAVEGESQEEGERVVPTAPGSGSGETQEGISSSPKEEGHPQTHENSEIPG